MSENDGDRIQLQDSFFHAPVASAWLAPDGAMLQVNMALCRLLGYSEQALLALRMEDITHSGDQRTAMEEVKQLLSGEIHSSDGERCLVHSDGSEVVVWLSVSLARDISGAPRHFIAHFQQPTAFSPELSSGRDLLDSLMATSPDHIYFKDLESRFVQVNHAKAWRHGLTHPDEAIGKTVADFFDQKHARKALMQERELMTTGRPMLDREERLTWLDGHISWASSTKVARRDGQGRIIGLIGISRDITERKLIEQKLRYNEQRYRSLVEATSSIVWITPASGEFESAQPGWSAFTGEPYEKICGWGWLDTLHPDDREETVRAWSQALERSTVYQVEHRVLRHDGVYRSMSARAIPIVAEDGAIVEWVGIQTDITDRKNAEMEKARLNEELMDLSRRAGMSEVATSVLHNVGNVLNSVNISCSVISEKVRRSRIDSVAKIAALLQEREGDLAAFLNDDPQGQRLPHFMATLALRLADEQKDVLEEVELLDRNIDHISQIVSLQQSYGNVGGVEETVSIKDLVEDALRMNTIAMSRHQIEVRREYEKIPGIQTEKHKVLQILVNLIRNAKHALTDGDNSCPRTLTLRIAPTSQQPGVLVSVIDNGIGIAAQDLTRVFAHGFTTRPEGHGFGLHSGAVTASQLGGTLTAHSDGPGNGAVFTLELPAQPPADPAR